MKKQSMKFSINAVRNPKKIASAADANAAVNPAVNPAVVAAGSAAGVAALLSLPPIFFGIGFNYGIFICCMMLIYVIATSGLDIVFGYCGQISLGHAAFYAIGAYCSGILCNYLRVPAFFSIIIGAAVAAFVAALLAYPASKLVFHFLALATAAFGEIVYQVISHSPNGITGNFRGLYSEPVVIFGLALESNARFYYYALACAAGLLVIKMRIVQSKIGRAFVAIRENPRAADGMGIDVRLYKVAAFSASAFYTAFAGGMYMHYAKYISPDTFVQKQSILFITMLLIGGSASLAGPVIGVASVMLLNELLRPFQDYQMLIYGILMLAAIVAIPGGLYGAAVQFKAYIWRSARGGVQFAPGESGQAPNGGRRAGR